METLRAAWDQSARLLAFEPMPNSNKAPEVFDPVPYLIAADWHMRNPNKNHGHHWSPKAPLPSHQRCKAGSHLQTSDVTSTRTITSRSLIIMTNRTSSDTRSSCRGVKSKNESIPLPFAARGLNRFRLALQLIRTIVP